MKIDLKGIKKSYGPKTVLSLGQLSLETGKIHGFVGENGVGKTTLLKIVSGLEEADEGAIAYDGVSFDKGIFKQITYVGPTPYLLAGSVFYNLAYPLVIRKYPKEEIKRLVTHMAKSLELTDLLHSDAQKLSAGESQKVVLGRALVFKPRLLLLDEPTANIDASTTTRIEKTLIESLEKNDVAIWMVSHNASQIERLCHTICRLKKPIV